MGKYALLPISKRKALMGQQEEMEDTRKLEIARGRTYAIFSECSETSLGSNFCPELHRRISTRRDATRRTAKLSGVDVPDTTSEAEQ